MRQFREEVAPQGDEIVLTKTCGGVFNGTNIEYVLRNLGIANLIVAGVITSGCVEVAVRDAADRGFSVTLAEDACSSWSEEMENAAIRAMSEIYAKVLSTEEIVSLVRAEIGDASSHVVRGRYGTFSLAQWTEASAGALNVNVASGSVLCPVIDAQVVRPRLSSRRAAAVAPGTPWS